MRIGRLSFVKCSLFVLCLHLIFTGDLFAIDVWWSGGGADNYWNTPANWSTGALPGINDTVHFDSTTKNCTLNGHISVGSLKFTNGYTGSFSTNNYSVRISNDAEFNSGGTFTFMPNDTIILTGTEPHNFSPRQDILFPLVVHEGTGTTTINFHEFRVKQLRIISGILEMNNSFNIDTIFIGSGATLAQDSAFDNSDTVKSITGNGNIHMRNSELCFDGSSIDLNMLSSVSSWMGASITFIGSNQTFTPSTSQMYNMIKQRGTGPTTVITNGLRVDTLELVSGEFNLGNGLSDSVHSAIKMNGGTLNFGSSVLKFAGMHLDLNGSGTIIPGTGAIDFCGMMNQTFTPLTDGVNPIIINTGMQTKIIGNHFKVSNVKIYNGTFEMDTSFNIDTIYISSTATFKQDSALGNSDTVRSITGTGNLDMRNSELCFDGSSIDLSMLSSLSSWMGASLTFIGSYQTLIPSTWQMYKKIKQQGTGPTAIMNNSLRVDTLELLAGEFYLGHELNDSVNSAIKMNGGTLNFGSSVLKFGGVHLDLNGSGTIIPGTGAIEFGSMMNQTFTPRSDGVHPIINNKGMQTKIIGNHFKISNVNIYSGTLEMDTSLNIDTIFIGSGATLRLDSALGNSDTVRSITGSGNLEMRNSELCFDGSSINLNMLSSVSSWMGGSITFIGFNQTFIPNVFQMYKKIKQRGFGSTTIIINNLRVDTLELISGEFNLGNGMNDSLHSAIKMNGGTLNFGSSVLKFGGMHLDLNGSGTIIPGTGAIEFGGMMNQIFTPRSDGVHPIMNNKGMQTKIIGDHFRSSKVNIYSGTLEMDTSFNIDTIFIGSGAILRLDSALGNSDTVRSITGTGALDMRNSELCFDGSSTDLNMLSNLSSWMGASIAFIGSNQTFMPSMSQMYKKIIQRGTGPTTIVTNNLRVDTLELVSGEFNLGNGLIDSVHSTIKMNGGTLNFGSSVLKFGGVHLDLNGSGMIIPGTGAIEFGSMMNQTFTPAIGSVNPNINMKGNNLNIKGNKLNTAILSVVNGTVIMDTMLAADSVYIENGCALSMDTVLYQSDTIKNFNGRGNLSFGKSKLFLTGNADFSLLNTINGNANIVFLSSGNQTFRPKNNYTFNSICKNGNGKVTVDSCTLTVNNLKIESGIWDWGTSNSDTIHDTLFLQNATMLLGNNTVAVTSFIDNSGIVNFGGGKLLRTGGNGIVQFSSASQIIRESGVLAFNSSLPSNVLFLINDSIIFPEIIKSGFDTVNLQGNLNSTGIILNSGIWNWGNGNNHTIDSLLCYGGGMFFNNSNVNIDSGNAKFSSLSQIQYGTGSLNFTKTSGTQILTPHQTFALPIIKHNTNSTLQLFGYALKCSSMVFNDGQLDLNGFNITTNGDFIISGADSLIHLEGRSVSAGGNIELNGSLGNILHCNPVSTWSVNAAGDLTADYVVLKNCNATGSKGVATFNSIDSGSNINWYFIYDTLAPDNEIVLHATAIDTGRIVLKWNPVVVDSLDFDSVAIWYKTGSYPISTKDDSAALVGYFSKTDTIDTVYGLKSHTLHYFALSVRDSSDNFASFTDSSRSAVYTKAQPPAITSIIDTVQRQSIVLTWNNPSGMYPADSIYLHTDTINGSHWELKATLPYLATSMTINLPPVEGIFKMMLSTSFDSAATRYSTDAAIDTFYYIIEPPVITTSIDTTDSLNINISWIAPSKMKSNDSFFVWTSNINDSDNWVLYDKYPNTTNNAFINFPQYGTYDYIVSTNWDSIGSIEKGNIDIDTICIRPSGNIFTWDISTIANIQMGDGIWGKDNNWTVNGEHLIFWPGVGNVAKFSGAGPASISVSDTQYVDSIIFDASGVVLNGGHLRVSSGVIQGNAIDTIRSNIETMEFKKKGIGNLYIEGQISSSSSIVENGILTLAGTSGINNIMSSSLVVKSTGTLVNNANEKINNYATISLDTMGMWSLARAKEVISFVKGKGTITGTGTGAGLIIDLRSSKKEKFEGIITGNINLFIRGNNAISDTSIIKLTGANTFSGAFEIASGDSIVNNARAIVQLAGGNDRLPRSTVITFGNPSAVNLFGRLILGDDTMRVEQTIAGINDYPSSGIFSIIGGNSGLAKLKINNNVTNTFNGSIGGNSLNANNIEIIKTGTGELVLNGNNTYVGPTTVSGGALYINGYTSYANTLNFSNGTVLGGNGKVDGNVNLGNGAVLSPGNKNNGELTLGSLYMASTCSLNIDIGTCHDTINVSRNLVLDGILNIKASGGTIGSRYTIVNCEGTITDNGIVLGYVPYGDYLFELLQEGNSIVLKIDTILPDTIAPYIFITSPDMQKLNSVPSIIEGNAFDSLSGIYSISILIQHNSSNQYWNGLSWTDSIKWLPATISENWTYTNTMSLREGLFTVKAGSSDSVGNMSYDTSHFSIDTTAPKATVSISGLYSQATWPGTISGAVNKDSSGIDSTLIKIVNSNNGKIWNGNGWDSASNWILVTKGNAWNYSLSSAYLSSSTYIVYAYSIDSVGNKQIIPEKNSFIFDANAPSVVSYSIDDNNGYINSDKCKLTINVSNADSMRICTGSDTSNSMWKIYTSTDSINIGFSNGNKKIFAQFKDIAGNRSSWIYDSTIIDTASVKLVVNENINSDGNWTGLISGTANDEISGVKYVNVQIKNSNGLFWNDTVWSSYAYWITCTGTNSWSYNFKTEKLSEGIYTMQINSQDYAGNKPAISIEKTYKFYNKPVCQFSASPLSGAAPLSVNFSDSSKGKITNYLWNFGDGGSDSGKNNSHIYSQPGTYSVYLRVNGFGGIDSNNLKVVVSDTVKPLPVKNYKVVAVNSSTATFSWSKPEDKDLDSFFVSVSKSKWPQSYGDGEYFAKGKYSDTICTIKGFPEDGITIYSRLFFRDKYGNWSDISDNNSLSILLPDGAAPENNVKLTMGNYGDSITSVKLITGDTYKRNKTLHFAFGKKLSLIFDNLQNIEIKDTIINIRTIDIGMWYAACAISDSSGNRSAFLIDSITIKNSAPTLSKLSDTTIYEKNVMSKLISFNDINNDSILVKLVNAPDGFTLIGNKIEWIAQNKHVGSHSVSIECRDKFGAAVFDTFTVNVMNVPEKPELSFIGTLIVYEDSVYNARLEIIDPDIKNTHSIITIKKPSWISVVGNNISGIPKNENAGLNALELICVDSDSLKDTVNVSIQVINTNDKPELISASVPDTMIEKTVYTATLVISEKDSGDSLRADIIKGISWIKVRSVNKTTDEKIWNINIEFNPQQIDTGMKEISIRITDKEGLFTVFGKNIAIIDANDPPQKPFVSKKIAIGAVQYTANSIDDRDAKLYYVVKSRLLQNDSVVYSDSTINSIFSIYPLVDGRYIFSVAAIDGSGLYSEKSIDTFVISGASKCVWTDTSWSMISAPGSGINVGSSLKNSDYLLHWDESGVDKQVFSFYQKKEEINTLEPSKSYWRKGSNPDTIQIIKGKYVNEIVPVKLHKSVSGWNQIASPYPYPVAWTRSTDILWKWNSVTKDYEEAPHVLEPWKGYWVKVDSTVETFLKPFPVFNFNGLQKLKKSFFAGKNNWNLQVTLSTRDGMDSDNRFGFDPDANDKFDILDRPEPPRMDGGPVLYFSHNDWKKDCNEFASDIRKSWNSINIFEIALTGKEKGNGKLTFDDIRLTRDIYVFTVDNDTVTMIEPEKEYKVQVSSQVSYKTVFVTDNAGFLKTIPLRFNMGNPYPNPFCPLTKINYTLPYRWDSNGKIILSPYVVNIAIYDIMGRKLRELVYRKMNPGNYMVSWDGKMESGRIVASGNYYCVFRADDIKSVKQLMLLK